MKLIISGGVNEHGRNCFLLQGENYNIIFDCGLGADKVLPSVTKKQAERTKYLFLSHSHADHIGAVEWLISQGFSGKIITTEETAAFLKGNISPDRLIILGINDFNNNESNRPDENLFFTFGRSGHCFGGVWFNVSFEGFKVIYSGDYCTKTNFICDEIVGQSADLAILDCCYADDRENGIDGFIDLVRSELKKGNIVLPVPKNGRGTYIAELLKCNDINFRFIDKPFNGGNPTFWYNGTIVTEWRNDESANSVYLLTDPQINERASREFIENTGSSVILTGTAEKDGYAEKMLKCNVAKFFRIPVHSNCSDVRTLQSVNNFRKTILFHSDKLKVDN